MSKSLKSKIRILEAKKSTLYQRVQLLYDLTKHLSDTKKANEFSIRILSLDSTIGEFKEVVEEIAILSCELNPDSEVDLQCLSSIDDLYCHITAANNKIKKAETAASASAASVSQLAIAQNPKIKLPHLELPNFSGEIHEWPIFYHTFKCIHENAAISDSDKLRYLLGKLSKKALALVAGYQPSAENYNLIWATIVNKFQDVRYIYTHYLKQILKMKPLMSESPGGLEEFLQQFSSAVEALKALELENLADAIILHLALSKLDAETVKAFEMSVRDQQMPTYEQLITFVKEKSKILSRYATASATGGGYNSTNRINKQSKTAHSFVVSKNPQPALLCRICSDNKHPAYHCKVFTALSPEKRYQLVKERNLCTNCLSQQHTWKLCKSKNTCSVCSKRHHSTLHFSSREKPNLNIPVQNNPENLEPEPSVSVHCSSARSVQKQLQPGVVVLSTATIYVFDRWGIPHKARALLDSASQSDFITDKFFRKLGVSKTKLETSIKGIGEFKQSLHFFSVVSFASRFNLEKTYQINPLIINKIADQLPTYEVLSSYFDVFKELPLADSSMEESGNIDVLLGAGVFSRLFGTNQIVSATSPLTAIQTELGYVVMGRLNDSSSTISSQSHALCCTINNEPAIEDLVKKFWELESMPHDSLTLPVDSECEKLFTETVKRSGNGRYSVALPFKRPLSEIGSSLDICKRRFFSLEKRLLSNNNLKLDYIQFMQDYEKKGHMSLAGKVEDGYFLPHLAVVRPDSVSTRLRVVFDASAKGTKNLSLNDILYTGPKLQADLMVILLGFRLFPVAITADIRQMYRQIDVIPEHRNAQRILWRHSPHDELHAWILNTVTFGVRPAPFLALRVIKQLCQDEQQRFPKAAEVANRDLFMDDLATSVKSEEEALEIYKQLDGMFRSGCFELVKWSSNSVSLLENIPKKDQFPHQVDFRSDSYIKILGLQWIPDTDCLSFKVKTPTENCTKRNILSAVSRIFDPLGFLAPVTLKAKLFIKQIWQLQLDWDESPPEEISKAWHKFKEEIFILSEIKILRPVSEKTTCFIDLIGFADASEKAYGSVVYLRTESEHFEINVHLLCAKSKVAPMKLISIPRLELCATVLLAKLMKLVIDIFSPRISLRKIAAFSDSEVTIHWISSSPSKWTTFVANRVAAVQECLPSNHWRHVKGCENPADCLSRGLFPKELQKHSLWFEGPTWLKKSFQYWPSNKFESPSLIIPEQKVKSMVVIKEKEHFLRELIDKFSNYSKLLHAVVYILIFCKRIPSGGYHLSPDNVAIAERELIRFVQQTHFEREIKNISNKKHCSRQIQKLNPFLEDGLIRVGGRLSNADISYDHKHPFLLPKNDHLVHLLIAYVHKSNMHTGANLVLALLRKKYWILGGRNLVRRVVQRCNFCFKHRPKNCSPLMGDLPASRVKESKPFLYSGVDYAGPFLVSMTRKRGVRPQKAYICLFVCLTIKAIHLELASDLSTPTFLEAFKRFIARRGPCAVIHSDCGTNFIGAKAKLGDIFLLINSDAYNNTISSELSMRQTVWKLNPPSAPHFGGLWEANVKSVKSHLQKVVGKQILSYEEFNTVLTQVEALLNSRPLSVLSSDPSEPSALTPAHFLQQAGFSELPAAPVPETPLNRLSRFQLLDKMVQDFWKRWHLEYLHNLQTREKWTDSCENAKVGTVVLIKTDNCPTMIWPLGVIEEVHPGKDGTVRVVTVRTRTGSYRRPVVKICPLPVQ